MGYEFENIKAKELFKKSGKSITEFAVFFGVTEKAVYGWFSKRNKPGLSVVREMARYFKVKEKELMRIE